MKKLLEDSDLGLDLTKKSDKVILRAIKHLAAIDELNRFYDSVSGSGVEFAHNCLRRLLIEVNCSKKSLENIPSNGAFILVCNFPHGILDGLLLTDTVIRKRPDAKIIGNFPLTQIEKFSELIIDVDPFSSPQNINTRGIKAAKKYLAGGHPLIIFPADKIGTKKLSVYKSKQNDWSAANIKFIHTAGVPIIPTHINGSNSISFEMMGIFGNSLQMLRLGRELLNKEGYSYKIEIGKPINEELHAKLSSIEHLSDFLRTNIELLKHRNPATTEHENREIETENTQNRLEGLGETVTNNSQNCHILLEEKSLIFYAIDHTLAENWAEKIFEYKASKAEQYIVGIDKLTKQAICLAEIRCGDKILENKGIEGLYTHQYFEYSHKYYDTIKRSIELGQRYVYQEASHLEKFGPDRAISTLIWRSAIALLENTPEYSNLIGTTSIREHYSALSKNIISNYIEINSTDKRLSKMAVARHSVAKIKKSIFNKKSQIHFRDAELTNKLIADSDHTEKTIPSTLKYLMDQHIHILALSSNHKKKNRINALILLEK